MPPFIELDALSVDLGRPIRKSIDGSFSGRAVGLLGPNGAGKTTLLQTLLGFHRPSSGTARILGMDSFALPEPLQRLSVVPVQMDRGPFAIVTEAPPAWLAVPVLLVFSTALVAVSAWRARSLEVTYGAD